MSAQYFPRAHDHIVGQAGQARYLDAVTFVRAPGFDAPQKHDLAPGLFDRHVYVFHAGQQLLEIGQLVVVRRE